MLSWVERARSLCPQPLPVRFPFQLNLWRTVVAGRVQTTCRPLSLRSRSNIPGRQGTMESKTSFFADGWQHEAVTRSGLFPWALTTLPGRKFIRGVATEARA